MSTELVRWCDMHQARGERVPGSAYDFGLRGAGKPFQWVTVDLCDVCAKAAWELTDELAEVGRPFEGDSSPTPSAAKVAKGGGRPRLSTRCPVCGEDYSSRAGMRTHVRTAHGQTLAQVEGRAAETFPCPDCGREFEGQAALTSHRRVHAEPTTEPDPTPPQP